MLIFEIFVLTVETVNAAYESFDAANAVYATPDKTKQSTASAPNTVPIYAMPDKRKHDAAVYVYSSVDKKNKKGNQMSTCVFIVKIYCSKFV